MLVEHPFSPTSLQRTTLQVGIIADPSINTSAHCTGLDWEKYLSTAQRQVTNSTYLCVPEVQQRYVPHVDTKQGIHAAVDNCTPLLSSTNHNSFGSNAFSQASCHYFSQCSLSLSLTLGLVSSMSPPSLPIVQSHRQLSVARW